MMEYTVDFESFGIEGLIYFPDGTIGILTDDEVFEKARYQAWHDHNWTLDDELFQDEQQKREHEYTAVFKSGYFNAQNEDSAWHKAEKFAKRHHLDIIEMDDGFKI